MTVNLIAPGSLYGDRISQLDLRLAKVLKHGRSRTAFGVEVYNVLNANAVVTYNNTFVPRQTMAAAAHRRDAAAAEDSPLNSTGEHCECHNGRGGSRVGAWNWANPSRACAIRARARRARAGRAQAGARLYSTRRDSEFSRWPESALPRMLDVGLERNVDYYSEFIDVSRFPDRCLRSGLPRFPCR